MAHHAQQETAGKLFAYFLHFIWWISINVISLYQQKNK
jgi:hypothetical protein